ncbi:MAG: polyprenyl synthetase family protein, partial [Candidatus Woesearchaeota archaeon]
MKILNEYKNKIENELKRFFKIKKAEAKNINYELLKFVEAFEEFTLRGGKRLRGLLIISTYAGCGKKVSNEIIKAAASMELLHSFLLVHDDIMDNDDLRRNGLTVHKIFQKKYNSADLGKAFGIVVGDLGYSYALELFLSAKFEVRSKLDALNGIAVMIKRCCYGQLM